MNSPLKKDYDVIIVGAGPAGSTLGYELSKNGVRTLILEKSILPRHKTCAGGITAKTRNLLDIDISPITHQVAYGFRVNYKNKKSFTKWHDKPLIYMVMRNEFDYLLAKRAQETGALLEENQRVIKLQITSDGVEVITDKDTFSAEIIVGADGARSMVAENMGLMKNMQWGIGMEAEIPVSEEIMASWDYLTGLDLGYIRGGYGWVFPKKDFLSIGIGGPLNKAKKLKPCYQHMLESQNLESQEVKLKSHFLPVRRRKAAIQKQRSLLLGDAAGLLDPLTGEGIYNAIRSAQIAAPVIIKSLQSDNVDLKGYQEAVDNELAPELNTARALARIFTWFPGLYYDTIEKSDRFWNASCRLLRGEETYTSLKKRLGAFQFIFSLLSR